ncbi:MAG: preprotein translocase subunit SecE [Candidatus Paceibacterota bacterium]|jgi:preprotein translocase subunit SecE
MKLVEYIKETKGEMKHVTWPTRKQATNYTFLVIGVSVAVALLLALADKIFALGLEKLIFNK